MRKAQIKDVRKGKVKKMEILMKRGRIKDLILIVIGTALMAVAINMIYDPMELVTGGVTGLAILIKHLTRYLMPDGFPIWATNIVFNVPLFLIAFKVLGIRCVSKTLFATASLTFFIYIIPGVPMMEGDYLLSALFGGIISGAGIGLVFLTMSTTGGTDMLGMLIQKVKPYYSVPQLILVIDGAIVLGGAVVFGIKSALYAIIAVVAVTKVSDGLLDGLKFAKSAYIVSDHYIQIADTIMVQLDRGVTGLHAQGMYSNSEKNVLFCVVSKKEMVTVLDIVYKIDPTAFVTINDVREVRGEGFIEYRQ